MKIAATSLLFSALMLTASAPIFADAIPYPTPNTLAPATAFSATVTGHIEGYFYGFSAADTDVIQMCDVTQSYCSPYTFNNQSTAIGTSYNFGAVNAGDVLVFNLDNLSTGWILSSDPAQSFDGLNHAYATAYTTMVNGIPAPGTFVGMEDLSVPGSDLDYNDDQFVFQNVGMASPTPEPSYMLLMGSGILLLGLGRLFKRKAAVA